MTIYTSYFAKAGQLPRHILPISICLKPPFFFKCYNYRPLAPTEKIFQSPEAEYVPLFLDHLSKLSAKAVWKDLHILSKGEDVALLCYENLEKFCHRHLVAQWLSEQLDISVQEYVYPAPPPSSDNLTLF